MTGTVSDPAASVSVRVNGSYYAATNNGDGTWSLPRGDISALAGGTYNVVAAGVNTSGIAAFDPTLNELSVGTTSPTVSIAAVTPNPSMAPITSLAIHFSAPVENFTPQALQLTFTASGGATASDPLEGATLTTTDNQNWTLGNLSGLDSQVGTYQLAVVPLGSNITDLGGDPLIVGAAISWTIIPPWPSVASIGPARPIPAAPPACSSP